MTDSRLALVAVGEPDSFRITRRVGGAQDPLQLRPLELHGVSLRLFVVQSVKVVDGRCETESYNYRLQRTDERESWLVRWDYSRRRPTANYPYPLAHLHIRGNPLPDGTPMERLHFPTARVPLEWVVWHLIAEWGVHSKTEDWQQVLGESIEGFLERRTAH